MMRKAILALGTLALLCTAARAQKNCGTDEYFRELKAKNPNIVIEEAKLNADIARQLAAVVSRMRANAKSTGVADTPWMYDNQVFNIPVVVHVISDYFTTSNSVVTDNQIFGAIDRLNRFYNLQNDTTGIIKPFKKWVGNAHIRFYLATKDPNGKPTRGIVRANTYLSNGGDEAAKLNPWAPDRYLNIYLENYIGRGATGGIVLAYATLPPSYADNPYSQGVISRFDQAFYGNIGDTFTLAHEVGHFFSLYHPWNNNNIGPESIPKYEPTSKGPICGDDEVDDTPPTIGHFYTGCTKLYDTLCAIGYVKDYDSVSYYKITGITQAAILAHADSSNATQSYNDSTGNIVGQSFTTNSVNVTLANIVVRVAPGSTNNGGSVAMSLYSGTTLVARSLNTQPVYAGSLLGFSFTGVVLAANTTYKFVIDTVSGQGHRRFSLSSSNASSYSGGTLYNGVGAGTAVPTSDLYFVINLMYRVDYPDTTNTQNVMDYSGCTDEMFTKGQVARMRATLRSDVGFRSRLVSDSNLYITGVRNFDGTFFETPKVVPTPDFSINSPYVCADNFTLVKFTNRTYASNVGSYNWTFSPNAATTSATSTDVLNTFKDTGWVKASLTVTANDVTGSDSVTRSYVVYAADPNPTSTQGFYQDFNPGQFKNWPIFNYYNSTHTWEFSNKAGVFDTTSIRFANYDNRLLNQLSITESPGGAFSDFYTPFFDLSGFGGQCNLDYFSAGAFRTSKPNEMTDSLIISSSNDCGATWKKIATYSRTDIGNNGLRADDYVPIWSDWKEHSITVNDRGKVAFRFRFKVGTNVPNSDAANVFYNLYATGNNFYMDRIRITDEPLGVKNGTIVDLGMSVAPNPTSGAATLSINGGDNTVADISVTDVTGKLVWSSSVKRNTTNTKVEIPAAAIAVKGMYLVKVVTAGATATQKLIVY